MTMLRNATVGTGDNAVELALFPWEDASAIAEELDAWLAESDAGITWLDDAPVSDPSYERWLAEGAPVFGFTFADGFAEPGELDALEDEPGYSESRQPYLW